MLSRLQQQLILSENIAGSSLRFEEVEMIEYSYYEWMNEWEYSSI